MKDFTVSMNSSGTFSLSSNVGKIEEYCAQRLKIKLNTDFLSQQISYYTLSFEPFSLSRKIVTENIYRESDTTDGIHFANGCIFCPVYDYISISPKVMVQIDAYETDSLGNVVSIMKSGIFTLEFSPSLTGEGMMLKTIRPDVKFFENVATAVSEALKTEVINGANIKNHSITNEKISSDAIHSQNLAENSVTSEKICEGSIVSSKLAPSCVTAEKLCSTSVTESKLADSSVSNSKICEGSVTESKIADNSVTKNKIANGSITETKLANGSVTPTKLDRAYLTQHQSLDGLATEDWVKNQGFVTNADFNAKLPEKLSSFENDIAVSFTAQSLTEEQKNTALGNIGAVKAESDKVLSQNDFTDKYKEKLDIALTEHQDISSKADVSALAKVSFSGSYDDLTDLPDLEQFNCGFNDKLKEKYDSAYSHSVEKHAVPNAEENVLEEITLNGNTVEVQSKTANLTVITFNTCEPIFSEV